MKILFLYAEVTGYLMSCLRALHAHPQVGDIRVYQGLTLPETDFRLPADGPFSVRNAIGRSAEELWSEIAPFEADVVFVSGWMFHKYYHLAKKLKAQGAVLVIGNDTPWYGTFRQWMGALSSPFWLSSTYDFMWVPGPLQHTFARRLGFPENRIRTGLLTADVSLFQRAPKAGDKPTRIILSVGSFLPNKGMNRLYAAFNQLLSEDLTGWGLHLVGSGPEAALLTPTEHIRITPFVQPQNLPQCFAEADVFALASLKESWGVVVHEAACMGLPLLISETAGAVEDFVEEEKSGFTFNPRDPQSLVSQMRKMVHFPEEKRRRMGEHSFALSRHRTPQIWAETLVQMGLEGQQK